MAQSSPKTVWILGAGFSRGLGAPLFRDLFQTQQVVAASGQPDGHLCLAIIDLYLRYGPSVAAGRAGTLWRDPEEFIDKLECARREGSERDLISSLLPDAFLKGDERDLDMAAKYARMTLAIECSEFLRGAQLEEEKWIPYRNWAAHLGPDDVVVTFNYDRVPEYLAAYPKSKLSVIVPQGTDRRDIRGTVSEDVSLARRKGTCPVFKLHGSVGWRHSYQGVEIISKARDFTGDLALAVPGPGKAMVAVEKEGFAQLWKWARESVSSAENIVFLGYRFPQTDAYARRTIVDAICMAVLTKALKTVKIVLGPDTGHQDVRRMEKLLTYSSLRPPVEVVPLFAEDFLDLESPAASRI